jgi:hypothetical protein
VAGSFEFAPAIGPKPQPEEDRDKCLNWCRCFGLQESKTILRAENALNDYSVVGTCWRRVQGHCLETATNEPFKGDRHGQDSIFTGCWKF